MMVLNMKVKMMVLNIIYIGKSDNDETVNDVNENSAY